MCNNKVIYLFKKFLIEIHIKPKYLYEKLHIDETRKTDLKDKKPNGVYLITDHYYVGYSLLIDFIIDFLIIYYILMQVKY